MRNPYSSAGDKVTRVLLADDHRLIGEAVATLLSTTERFSVDTAETYGETIDCLVQSGPYDIVMLDLRMPGLVGLDGIRQVVEKAGDGQVVLFSANADRHTLSRAIEMGVRGLIPKTMPLQSLVSVLRLIESGQMFVPANALDEKQPTGDREALSDIELYVLRLAAAGLTNKHIANDLKQSETTIKMHMRSICKKLGARNRAHAAVIGRDMSIIES
ncbi:MAG: response regulator [Paracoccaceae bacterium]|uniref:response regulator n=1 Tax=Seohaeicola saemankumensis TaxID=481181 RepID=UPI001E305A35|nr:response regulator transcription factor [Seohaeicola saemankumensis]MCD1628217.1 response regulator transcription factor [Seohaeicola saemankumensis]